MVTEYMLLLLVFAILLFGRIVSDIIHDQQRWFCFYEQRKMTFPNPKRVRIWQDIPAHYRALFSENEEIPYMIYLPGSSSVLFKRKEKLIVLSHNRLILYEGNPASVQEIYFDEILFIEHGKMLFSFWLTIVCESQTYTIRYNRGENDFFPVMDSIRLKSYQVEKQIFTPEDYQERKKINWLSNMHYKFMNTAKRSLLPGQRIVEALFQPSYTFQKNPYLQFMKHVYNPHLCMMTDNELILIQERKTIRTMTYDQYSVKKLFIPYQNIQSIHRKEDNNHETLQIILSLKGTLSLPLSFTKENERAQSFFKTLQQMMLTTTAN